MRFLIDNALSPLIADVLNKEGYVAIHVRDIGMTDAKDEHIFQYASKHNHIIVSADTDFGYILANLKTTKPSVILFRKGVEVQPKMQIQLLLNNMDKVSNYLQNGTLVIFEPKKIRLRKLPIYE
ncbi:MAG: DUF5615 family PIN-like protein [Bacteroidota bacterium]